MNLERLRAVQAEERESDSLRALPDSFYREVADYIEALRDERAAAAEAAEDPFDSEEVRRLTDEVETAEEVAEAIYERRVGKLVKRASLAAAGMPSDEAGLTTEEAELFATLVERIEAHREDVLSTFDGERDVEVGGSEPAGATEAVADDTDADSAPSADGPGAADETGPEDASAGGDGPGDEGSEDTPPPPPDEPLSDDGAPSDAASAGPDGRGDETADGDDAERLTLRITADVGEVFGVDERVYDLAAEDVVTLPEANAKPLLERDAAERVE